MFKKNSLFFQHMIKNHPSKSLHNPTGFKSFTLYLFHFQNIQKTKVAVLYVAYLYVNVTHIIGYQAEEIPTPVTTPNLTYITLYIV